MERPHSGILVGTLMLACLLTTAMVAAYEPPDGAGRTSGRTVSFRRLGNGDIALGGIRLHHRARELSFAARLHDAEYNRLEVLVATPCGRLHETLLCADIRPLHLQTMLYLLGLENGVRTPQSTMRQGAVLDIELEWTDASGRCHREPVENWIHDMRTGTNMARSGWIFVGSSVAHGVLQAGRQGNLVLLYCQGETILATADSGGLRDTVFRVNHEKVDPGITAKVRVFLTPRNSISQ